MTGFMMTGFIKPSVPVEEEGKYLHFRWSFTVPLPIEQVRHRLQAYFSKLGYTPTATEDALVMRRGSLLRSMLIWTPRSLAAKLTVRCTPTNRDRDTQVALELTVDKTGHWIFDAECELLAIELVEAEHYLLYERADFAAMNALNRHVRQGVVYAVLMACVIFCVLFVPLVVVAVLLNIVVWKSLGINWVLVELMTGILSGTLAHFVLNRLSRLSMSILESRLGRRRF